MAFGGFDFAKNVTRSQSRIQNQIEGVSRTGELASSAHITQDGIQLLQESHPSWIFKEPEMERDWFVRQLQDLAREKLVRITILGGRVGVAGVGQFNASFSFPRRLDFRYMPNVISPPIASAPASTFVVDVLSKRNKIHHLDSWTVGNMIKVFSHDFDGKPRSNKHFLARRGWCSIRACQRSHIPIGSLSSTGPEAPEREENFDMKFALDISMNFEVDQHDPSGITMPHRLLVVALHKDYD
jgi:hypothetical protein